MKSVFCDLYSLNQQLQAITNEISNLENSINKLNDAVFTKNSTVNNLNVLGSESCDGNLIVHGKTTCAGDLQLNGVVLANDGKNILINPGNLSCAFNTIQATQNSENVDSLINTNANKSINNINSNIYVNDINTIDYTSIIKSSSNFHSIIQIDNLTYKLQPIELGGKTFLGYVLI